MSVGFRKRVVSIALRRLGWQAAAALLGLCVALSAASAALARPYQPPSSVTLAPKFRAVGNEAVLTDGAYVFRNDAGVDGSGRLVDEQTSTRWAVPGAPGCSTFSSLIGSGNGSVGSGDRSELIGNGWLLGLCSGTGAIELYSIPNGPWKALATPMDCQGQNLAAGISGCVPDAVGADWIELQYYCYHCQTVYTYENTTTGAERSLTPRRRSVLDLDSETLSRPVCQPLSVPTNESLTFDGSYVVAARHQAGAVLYSQPVLGRCRTRVRQKLGRAVFDLTGTPGLILWQASQARTAANLGGVFLPSRQPFTIRLPPALAEGAVDSLSVTPRHIYIFGGAGEPHLWSADLPKPSKPHHVSRGGRRRTRGSARMRRTSLPQVLLLYPQALPVQRRALRSAEGPVPRY